MDGDCVSAGEGADGAGELWKSFAMSLLSSFAGAEAAGDGAEDDAPGDAVDTDGRVTEALPLLAAGTVPNDLTIVSLSVGGAGAGEEDICAEASSIDPNVTGEPCFPAAAAPMFRGMVTPSLIGTAEPRALGRLECVNCGCCWAEGAGDCERGDGADVCCGGPFDQADFAGSDLFVDVVEDLLIEFWRKKVAG